MENAATSLPSEPMSQPIYRLSPLDPFGRGLLNEKQQRSRQQRRRKSGQDCLLPHRVRGFVWTLRHVGLSAHLLRRCHSKVDRRKGDDNQRRSAPFYTGSTELPGKAFFRQLSLEKRAARSRRTGDNSPRRGAPILSEGTTVQSQVSQRQPGFEKREAGVCRTGDTCRGGALRSIRKAPCQA